MRRHTLQRFQTARESHPIDLVNLADLGLILAFMGLLVPQLVLVSPPDLIGSTGPAVSEALLPRATVTITLTNGGGILWDREVITLSELELRVRAVKDHHPQPQVFLLGEYGVQLGVNIKVRSLLRGLTFTEAALRKEG
jgi:biopolymer transport protein ExbD